MNGRHSALVRNDNGGLEVRRFESAADATQVSAGRELRPLPDQAEVQIVAGRQNRYIRSAAMARRLGLHPRTIRRCYERGGLPGAREHSTRILDVPTSLMRLAEAYGLRQVERMAKAGLLTS